ncbi:MAG: lipocalin-like domain-containing protein [Candidatus Methylomirabilota bacterium]
MKAKTAIGLLTVAAILACTGMVGAQTAPVTPKVQLPSGETVWDLSGDWEATIENYGLNVGAGTYPNVYRITQTGSAFQAIRLRDIPPPAGGKAGSLSLQGELEKNGFKRVDIVLGRGDVLPSKGLISGDGKKIFIDDGFMVRVTLTRSGDRGPIVGIWRLVSFEREYQAMGEREYPMGRTPTGYILFQPDGRMWVVITAEGRKAPTTDQDRAGLFTTLVAYTGRYRVDGDKWITTVEVSSNPAWVGTEQTRAFEISGDRLKEMTAWAARPDNRMARAVITYERAK